MRRAVLVGLAALGGACGALLGAAPTPPTGDDAGAIPDAPSGDDGGALPDAPALEGGDPCAPSVRFRTITPLTTLNISAQKDAPRLTPDELTVYFEATVTPGEARVYVATRGKRTDPFGTPTVVALDSVMGEGDATPMITDDGLTLFFVSGRNSAGGFQVFVATRVNTASDWSQPRLWVSDSEDRRFPYLASDGKLWFAFVTPPLSGTGSIAWRPRDGGPPETLAAPSVNAGFFEYAPVVSADARTIYFSSYRPDGGGGQAVWSAELLPDGGAGEAAPLPELTVPPANEVRAGWISPDGCRLYFASGVNDALDLFVAERP